MTHFLVKDPQIEAEIASHIQNVFKVAYQPAPITPITGASTRAQASRPVTASKSPQFRSTVGGQVA